MGGHVDGGRGGPRGIWGQGMVVLRAADAYIGGGFTYVDESDGAAELARVSDEVIHPVREKEKLVSGVLSTSM